MTIQFIQTKTRLNKSNTYTNKFLICTPNVQKVYINEREIELIPGETIELNDNDLSRDWARYAVTKGYLRAISP